MIIHKYQLWWTGHLVRLGDDQFLEELRKHFKNSLSASLFLFGLCRGSWEVNAQRCKKWRLALYLGAVLHTEERFN